MTERQQQWVAAKCKDPALASEIIEFLTSPANIRSPSGLEFTAFGYPQAREYTEWLPESWPVVVMGTTSDSAWVLIQCEGKYTGQCGLFSSEYLGGAWIDDPETLCLQTGRSFPEFCSVIKNEPYESTWHSEAWWDPPA